jgi:hypothetical protein
VASPGGEASSSVAAAGGLPAAAVYVARNSPTWPDCLPRRVIRPRAGGPGTARRPHRPADRRVTPPGGSPPIQGLARLCSGSSRAGMPRNAYYLHIFRIADNCGGWPGCGGDCFRHRWMLDRCLYPFRDLRYLCFAPPEGIRSRRERHPVGFTSYRPPPRSLLVGIRPASRTCGKADPQPDCARESRVCYTSCYR